MILQPCLTNNIGLLLARFGMIATVYFDDELMLQTGKINNKLAYDMLPQKLHAQAILPDGLP